MAQDLVVGVTNGQARYPGGTATVDGVGTLVVLSAEDQFIAFYARGYWSHVWFEDPREDEKEGEA
jgi:hypothetical protein